MQNPKHQTYHSIHCDNFNALDRKWDCDLHAWKNRHKFLHFKAASKSELVSTLGIAKEELERLIMTPPPTQHT